MRARRRRSARSPLPLYPHDSRTTTGSSLKAAGARARRRASGIEIAARPALPATPGYVDARSSAHRGRAGDAARRDRATGAGAVLGARAARVVHQPRRSLPRRVRITVAAVTRRLGLGRARAALLPEPRRPADAGWARTPRRPSTSWPRRARAAVVVVPIAFTGEHIETLQEIDILYKRARRAARASCTSRARAPSECTRRSSPRSRIWSRRRRARAAGPEARVRITIVGGGISGPHGRPPLVARGPRGRAASTPAPAPGGLIPASAATASCARRARRRSWTGRPNARADRAAGLAARVLPARARGAPALHLRRRRAAPVPREPARAAQTTCCRRGGKLRLFARAVRRGAASRRRIGAGLRRAPLRARGGRARRGPRRDRRLRGRRGGAVDAQRPAPRRRAGARARQRPARRAGARAGAAPAWAGPFISRRPRRAARARSRARWARAGAARAPPRSRRRPAAGASHRGRRVRRGDAVVLATPAAATAALLAAQAPAAAAALRAIPHAPGGGGLPRLPRRRRPRHRSRRLRLRGRARRRRPACSAASTNHRSSPAARPTGGVLLRALLGGPSIPALVDADDAAIAAQAVGDLRRVTGLAPRARLRRRLARPPRHPAIRPRARRARARRR